MKYTMTVTIANPDTPQGMSSDLVFKIDCTFDHDSKQYGNGWFLRLKKRGIEGFENIVDLRYNDEFDPENKPEYLEKWARSYWSGKDGAYYVKSLRIEKAEQTANTEDRYPNVDGVEVVENAEAMRIQLIFDGKPSEEIRTILKSHGFRWSPSFSAWQRQLTENGKWATKKALEEIARIEE